MPGENTPYTQLDANQVLTQSFNEENDSIRVDVGAKVNIDVGQLEITIDKDEDSVTSYQGGTWSVDVPDVATAAKQDEQSLLLNSIDDVLANVLTELQQKTEPTDTQPISAVSLPLPTGASTSALQTTGNTSLSSIDGKLTTTNSSLASIDTKLTNPIPVSQSGTWSVSLSDYTSTTGTVTAIARSATVQTALAANSSRKSYLLWNDSGANCFVKFATGATTADFSVRISSNSGYEPPGTLRYTGIITVIWGTGGAGNLLVTEYT